MKHTENPQNPEPSNTPVSAEPVEVRPSADRHPSTGSGLTVQEETTLPARAAPADPGWTPARQRYFLSRLADTGNVLGVCREMDMSRQSAYALRARDAAFARAWQGAMLRHRDALVDICMERATIGVREEIVVDGALVERTKPDGAMLRHMLNRADRLCDDGTFAARPAHQSELHFEALLDCIDPDETAQAEGGPPDRAELLACIAESAELGWDKRDYPGLCAPGSAPRAAEPDPLARFASEEEAADALIAYKYLLTMRPEEVDISDLDPAAVDEWTEEQWLRAEHSGLADRLFGEDEGLGSAEETEDRGGGAETESAPERERERGGDP